MYMTNAILDEVYMERLRQVEKWGTEAMLLDSSAEWDTRTKLRQYLLVKLSVLGEEFGEMCMARNDGDVANLRTEAIQVAAVAVAIVEGVDLATNRLKE